MRDFFGFCLSGLRPLRGVGPRDERQKIQFACGRMEVRQVLLQMCRVVQRLKYLSSGLRSSGFSAGGQEVRDIHLVMVISVFWLDFSLENRTICLNLASLSSAIGRVVD